MQHQPIEIKTEPNAVGALTPRQGASQPASQLSGDLTEGGDGADTQTLLAESGEPAKTDSISPARKHASQIFLLVGLALMMLMIFRMLKKNSRNRKKHEQAPHPVFPQVASNQAGPNQDRSNQASINQAIPAAMTASRNRIEQLMADAEELTRRLAAHMDNKAAHLEALLTQTEARIAELESLLAHASKSPSSDSHTPGTAAPGTGYAGHAGHTAVQPHAQHAQTGSDAQLLADREPALDPFHRRVYVLADQGQSSIDIARQLDRPTGQIELVLALRKK
mgnify:CR=1 FL=1